jgi:hypothetical protein
VKRFLDYLTDSSARWLVASNAATLILALLLRWDLMYLLVVYWCQSVIIGYYNWRRMRALKSFSTAGFTSNGRAVPENEKGKLETARFFAIHYGFFHFVYAAFLLKMSKAFGPEDWAGLAVAVLAFQRNHGYSFQYHVVQDLKRRMNIGSLLFFPYLRVLPMHVMILAGAVLGGTSVKAMLMFAALKTGSDLLMHAIEHHWDGEALGEDS